MKKGEREKIVGEEHVSIMRNDLIMGKVLEPPSTPAASEA